jgi:hypothetical protein
MNNHDGYLRYLTTEMTIMGILSAFFVAVPAFFIEKILSADQGSIAYSCLSALSHASIYLVVASILFLVAALFFYRQRSRLAWLYGQIALEAAMPEYTEHRIHDWLKEADSWQSWIPYNTAFWISIFAVVQCLLAALSSCTLFAPLREGAALYSVALLFLMLLWLLWVRRNSVKFKYEESLPYFRIR